MRLWPFRRGADIEHGAADAALQRAESDRSAAEDRWPAVNEMTQSLREARGINHFRESLSVALRLGD